MEERLEILKESQRRRRRRRKLLEHSSNTLHKQK
jgi:hypothetical protein